MKILICTHGATMHGGANRSLLMIIDGLKQICGEDDISVIVPSKKGAFKDALTDRGIKCYPSLYFGVTSSIRNDGKDWMRVSKIFFGYLLESVLSIYYAFKFRNSGFDIVYTNTRGPILGAKIAKKLRIPHVVHVREFGGEKPMFGFWGYKKMYEMSDKIILISQALYDEYKLHIPEDKLIEISNGIESPLNLPIHPREKGSGLNMLLTGRLVPDKGHKEAIRAMKILKDRGFTDIHLYIAGGLQASMHIDYYKNELDDLIKECGLQNEITFCGEVKDMVSLRSSMNVELMTAIRETFGRVTVEGMRSGLVLIGANTGGTVEIIQDGETGYLYQQGSEVDLADKIQFVHDNPEKANEVALAGYNYSQTHFTAEENIKKVYSVLSDNLQ